MKLSRLCEQDKILQELEAKIRSLKDDKVFVVFVFRRTYVRPRPWPCLSRLRPGQAGVSAGRFAPADGAVQGPAGPRWEDCLSAEIITGGRRAHQGRNIPNLNSKTQISHNALHVFLAGVVIPLVTWHCDLASILNSIFFPRIFWGLSNSVSGWRRLREWSSCPEKTVFNWIAS